MEQEKDKALQKNPGTMVRLEKKNANPFKRERGSGFFVAPDKIATNIHVIAGARTVTAKCVDTNTFYTIEGIVAFDDINDLVILKVAAEDTPFSLGDSDTVQIGDTVCAIGYSVTEKMIAFQLYKLSVSLVFLRDSEKSMVEGTVHAIQNSGERIELNMPDAEQGYSGGPVLNSKGEAIAILFQGSGELGEATSLNRFEAISANSLKELLSRVEQAKADTSIRHPLARSWISILFRGKKRIQPVSTEDASQKPKAAVPLPVESMARWQKRPRIRAYTKASCGNAKGNTGNYKGAIAAFNKAIELNPDLADAYNNRGAAKGALGDFEGAIEDFDTAIRLNPEYVSAYNNRGNAKKALGNTKGAIEDYDMAIQLNPEDADFFNNRGVAKDKLSDFVGAIEDYDTAIRLNPEHAKAHNNRDKAKKALGQQEDAGADFAK